MTAAFLTVPDVLDLLNYTPTEHVSICDQRPGATFTSHIMATPQATISGLDGANVWFGVNPVDPTSRGRGTAAQVTRWSALWADLDVKAGGCPDMDTARTITDVVSSMLTSRPVALIYSGHGLQPLWAIDPDDKEAMLTDRKGARALLRRFGRLIAAVAERHNSGVDSVFDLARVLRAPGTVNYKDPTDPRSVLTLADTGHPIALTDLREALDAYGISEIPEDSEELGAVISPPASWKWADHTCGYAATTIRGWSTDTPTARHPWLVSAAVRLATMHAAECITAADHHGAIISTVAQFRHVLATTSPTRDPTPGEIGDAFGWGQAKASTMTPERIARELGGHTHDKSDEPFGAVENAQFIEHPEETPAQLARRMFPILDWHALWADDEEDEWIHEPLLPARRSVAIYSAPKVGKSLLMLDMATAISRAEVFLGYTPTRRVRVLYVDFENDPKGDIRSRLQAMGYKPDDLDYLDYLSFPTMAGLDTERGALELLEAVKAYGSEVVMVDTVSRAVQGEENSNDTWLAMYRHTGLKLKQAGIAIVRLDHTGKDETKGTRGGSAKSGDVDAIWKLTKVTDSKFRLECTSSRMTIPSKSMSLTRQEIPRLHHGVDAVFGFTDKQAKTAAIIALCDSNDLPPDAGRETVRDFVKSRGMKVANAVIQAVVKTRKAVDNPVDKPDRGFRSPPRQTVNLVPDPVETVSDGQAANLSTKQGDRDAPVTSGHPGHGAPDRRATTLWGGSDGHPGQNSSQAYPGCVTCGAPIETKRRWAGMADCLTCQIAANP